MRLHQAIRAARAGGGVPRQRLIIDIGRAGMLVVWEPSGEVRTLIVAKRPAEEREAS